MTGIKSLLKDYKEVGMTTVTVANGDILPAKGVGNISFKSEHGYVTFTGVLHVPGLDRNIISVRDHWKTGTRYDCKEVWFLLFN